MKLYRYFSSFIAVVALLFTACSPDDYGLNKKDISADQLVEGEAFTVTVDDENTVTLTSLLDNSYTVYWTHPNGRTQGKQVKLQLPFAGTYEVSMGVDTRGGVVYGEPYKFTITTNNMSLLEDPLYEYLTGGVNCKKKWVPVDKAYGVGQCTGPVMYCNPGDVLNDGSNSTDLAINHMVPNWDPGFQSWLIAENDPYMDSYMEFELSDVDGCILNEYRGEAGTKGASTGTHLTGKWNLNLSDKTHPKLSFIDTYSMHNIGFDATCDNYTNDIIITELTPYVLQLATMRTNSEGAWWLVWNFIAADVQDGTVEIPSGEKDYINPSAPVLPEYDNLKTDIYTVDINGVEYVGQEATFKVSDDPAYDWLWWNGGSSAWESVVKGNYGINWAPAWPEDVADIEITFGKPVYEDEAQTKLVGYNYSMGDYSGTFNIVDNKIVFDEEVTFFVAKGPDRTVALTGDTWQVLKCDPTAELVLGIPAGTDANGNTNAYLVVNLVCKPVGGASTGPVDVPFVAENLNNYIQSDSYFRAQVYNPWGGGGDAIDPANIKLKKNQKINITVELSGFNFSQPAKMVLCCNRGSEQAWEPDCFGYSRAITVDGDGEYTVSWTNDTGSTVKWDDGTSALTVQMQYVGYATLADESDAGLKAACTLKRITIE